MKQLNKILVLNAGSSSYKLALYEAIEQAKLAEPQEPLWQGHYSWGREDGEAELSVSIAGHKFIQKTMPKAATPAALQALLETALEPYCDAAGNVQAAPLCSLDEIVAVGHRVVHGGSQFLQPIAISDSVKAAIDALSSLAPLHNPANLAGIEAMQMLLPDSIHIAAFDTSYHSTIPAEASTYAIPYCFHENEGVKRYGFHGISHEYCANRAACLLGKELAELKILCCHLGNGSSLAAIANGCSIDTTMGLTALEGMMMGSRPGNIDPGILLYLLQEKKKTSEELFDMLYFESGLKGISGYSDFRKVAAAAPTEALAHLALLIYLHSLKKNIGSMLGSLGAPDLIIFTGGIGENAAAVREEACRSFKFLGWDIDKETNERCSSDAFISKTNSSATIGVIATKEEWSIACSCMNCL